jgi:type II secretory pathway pseudopilin PulG
MRFNTKKLSSGQSLVEVMIALAVLTSGFLGILTLLSQSIAISKTVGQQTTATYLAEEGIEIAKNLVDHDMYAHIANPAVIGWGNCFSVQAPFSAGGKYELDYTTTDCTAIRPYSASDLLEFNPTTNMYLYAYNDPLPGGVPTIFSRDIQVIPDPSIPEITVNSIVSWPGLGGVVQSVNLEDHFYNWHP